MQFAWHQGPDIGGVQMAIPKVINVIIEVITAKRYPDFRLFLFIPVVSFKSKE
jgi:hypothetical protein